jgi:hypothetical protein
LIEVSSFKVFNNVLGRKARDSSCQKLIFGWHIFYENVDISEHKKLWKNGFLSFHFLSILACKYPIVFYEGLLLKFYFIALNNSYVTTKWNYPLCFIRDWHQDTNKKRSGKNFKGWIKDLIQDHRCCENALRKEIGVCP